MMELIITHSLDHLEDSVRKGDLSHLSGMTYKDGILAALDYLRGDSTLDELLDT